MATRPTVNGSLTPELSAFLQSRVSSGRYQTTSEVVREALRLLERQEQERDQAFQQLKAKFDRGPHKLTAASCSMATKCSANSAR